MGIENKIAEYTDSAENYKKAITACNELIEALLKYDKNTINKRFFEQYFTLLHDQESLEYNHDKKIGDARVDYTGKIVTSYRYSTPQYSFQKGKNIYLDGGHSITQIESTNKATVLQKAQNMLADLQKNLDYCDKKIKTLQNFKIEEFKKEYKKLLARYNGDSISYEVHEEIKYLG